MKRHILIAAIILGAAGLVLADYDSDMLAASALCTDKKHNEAIQAWINLGDSCSDPEQQYEATRKAAECTRLHSGDEARALELADRIKTEPYGKACRLFVYQWSASFSNVLAEFQSEDFSIWPEDLASIGYRVRGAAYFNLKNGQGAAHDYLKAFQCSKYFDKWTSLRMLGNTYWKLLDDELVAEACFRKCVSDFGGGHPGLSARVDLANLLISQKRYNDALKCLSGDKNSGSWAATLTAMEAKVYAAMGKKAETITSYEAALKTFGIMPHQQKEYEKILSELKQGSTQQPVSPAK